ncbi:hypothetical protein V8C86DRAFT_370218 [Haematococcus lacustris]
MCVTKVTKKISGCCSAKLVRRVELTPREKMATMRAKTAACGVKAVAPARLRPVVCAASSGWALRCDVAGNVSHASVALASIAAAVLIAAPVQAGVVIQQPQLKKVFQSDDAPPVRQERAFRTPGSNSAPSPAAEEKKAASSSVPSGEGGLDPQLLALPVAIGAIGGLGLAASKVDEGFTEWIQQSGAIVRNSENWAGFEEALKGEGYLAPAGTKAVYKIGAPAKKAAAKGTLKGTVKGTVKKAVAKAESNGTGFSMPELPKLPEIKLPF